MKREVKLLLEKACDSLLLSIELFNRPHDRGRVSGALIQLDHSFEMLMKAAIVHRGGRIRDKSTGDTIGFDTCVGRALSDGQIKYLTEEQSFVLKAIHGLRNAAQHYLLGISEGQLYVHVQSGVTLFRDILWSVFKQKLVHHLPSRVLPVSVEPPTDLITLFDTDTAEIKKLLRPGRRRRVEAMARLRSLAILDATIRGEEGQPSDAALKRLGEHLVAGNKWEDIFKGVASVSVAPEGSGHDLSLRISKKEGAPVHFVPEGTPGASVVATKHFNELDFYSLGAKGLASKLSLTVPKLVAVVWYISLKGDPDCYKEIKIGSSRFTRYSPKAIERVRTVLNKKSIDEVWREYKASKKSPTGGAA